MYSNIKVVAERIKTKTVYTHTSKNKHVHVYLIMRWGYYMSYGWHCWIHVFLDAFVLLRESGNGWGGLAPFLTSFLLHILKRQLKVVVNHKEMPWSLQNQLHATF